MAGLVWSGLQNISEHCGVMLGPCTGGGSAFIARQQCSMEGLRGHDRFVQVWTAHSAHSACRKMGQELATVQEGARHGSAKHKAALHSLRCACLPVRHAGWLCMDSACAGPALRGHCCCWSAGQSFELIQAQSGMADSEVTQPCFVETHCCKARWAKTHQGVAHLISLTLR